MSHDDDKAIEDLDRSFGLLLDKPSAAVEHERMKRNDREWKEKDPIGYKRDMEAMCKEMFGDRWLVEYEAMLREEFPEEFEEPV